MIYLPNTTDKMQLITSAAGNIDVQANWVDAAAATLVPSAAGRTNTNITTATTTDIVPVPGASTTKTVKQMTIRNKHASIVNDVTVQYNQNATLFELHKETLQPGECLVYHDGIGFFKLAAASTGFGDILERSIDADQTGASSTSAQNWFPTNGAVAVEAGVTYDMEGLLDILRAAGATTHTVGILFAGTATLTHILWDAITNNSDTSAAAASNSASARVATNVAVHSTASTSTTEEKIIKVHGTVKINAAGTFIPQFQYITNAPGGAPTIKTGSYFRLTKKGASFNTKGTWT